MFSLQDDVTLLRYVNDYHRTVYAFEMLPAPTPDETGAHDAVASQGVADVTQATVNDVTSSSHTVASATESHCDVTTPADERSLLNNAALSGSGGSSTAPMALENRADVNWQSNMLTQDPSTSALNQSAHALGEVDDSTSAAVDEGTDTAGDDNNCEEMEVTEESKPGRNLIHVVCSTVYVPMAVHVRVLVHKYTYMYIVCTVGTP